MNFKDFIAILVLFSAILSTVIGQKPSVPEWKLLFRDNRKWTGYYQFYNRPHACNIQVHSVEYDKEGSAYITFKTDGVVMELNAFSDDNTMITMKKTTSYNNTDRFPVDQDFQTEGVFKQRGTVWQYVANITLPKGKGFQTLHLHATSTSDDDSGDGTKITEKDRSMSLGLAVGIPVTLAIILMITGISIGVWAIRKGYLRHVPRAYKNFRNQAETPVSYDKSEPTNVHI